MIAEIVSPYTGTVAQATMHAGAQYALRVADLDVYYGKFQAVRSVDLNIQARRITALIGPSGCGKSTLLRLLAGLIRPIAGEVRFRGRPLAAPSREIGFVFQRAALMPWRTVSGNIALPLEIGGTPAADLQRRTRELIALVGLDGFADAYPRQLSGGMQQRVALARALIHEPGVLLLDEPFGSLDALTRERMNAELLRIWSVHQRTVVMVTHSISEAVLLADRILVMSPRPGQVRAEFAVPLPRPRQPGVSAEPDFLKLTRAVRAEIVD